MVWGLLFLSDRSERCCQSVSVSSPYNKMPYSFGFRSQPFACWWGLWILFLLPQTFMLLQFSHTFPFMPILKIQGCTAMLLFGTQKTAREGNGPYPNLFITTALLSSAMICGLVAAAVKPVCCCWVSAYNHLLCEDVQPAPLSCDRSLFLSEWHLEGHCHYFNVLVGLICINYPLPCGVFFLFFSTYFSRSLHCLRSHRTPLWQTQMGPQSTRVE